MTNDEARPAAGGPVHRRYCGECGTRIDQLCPKCYPAAQPEAPKALRKAIMTMTGFIPSLTGEERKALIDGILSAVGPLVEAREQAIKRLLIVIPTKQYIDDPVTKEVCQVASALIGGDDE